MCKICWFGLDILFKLTISAEKIENIILFPTSYKAYKKLKLTHHFGQHSKFWLKILHFHDHVGEKYIFYYIYLICQCDWQVISFFLRS